MKKEGENYIFASPRAPPIIPKTEPMIKPPPAIMLIIENTSTSMLPTTSFPGI